MNWTIEQKTRLTFGLVLALVIVAGITSYEFAFNSIQGRRIVAQYRQINSLLQDIQTKIDAAESSQRQFLITGDETDLNPYQTAIPTITQDLSQLQTLVADNASQQQHLAQLTPLVSQELAVIAQTITTRKQQGFEAARGLILSGQDKRLYVQIAGLIQAMVSAETNLQNQISTQTSPDAQAQSTLVAFILLAGLTFAILGFTYVLIERDLSGRLRLENLLSEERARLRMLIDTLPDLIYIKDREGRFLVVNQTTARWFGQNSPDALIGTTDFDHFSKEAATQYRSHELAILTSGEPLLQHEEPVIDPEGEKRTLLTTKIPVFNREGKLEQLVGIGHDITERKRAEDEVEQLNESLRRQTRQLEAANKELEAFSYSVSHDLRSPLRAIDGFSRILVNEYGEQLPEEALRFLQIICDGATEMGQLIDGLLSFSRLSRQSLTRQRVEPASLVRRILEEELRSSWETGKVDLVIGDLPLCDADPVLLRQVFVNLLSNAFKFTGKRESPRIEVGFRPIEGEGVYFVSDNGAGFDQRYVHKLFGVFQRLHSNEQYEGTGVGLAIVQRIIQRHGGHIWAEGAVDHGATFYFTLAPQIEFAESSANAL